VLNPAAKWQPQWRNYPQILKAYAAWFTVLWQARQHNRRSDRILFPKDVLTF